MATSEFLLSIQVTQDDCFSYVEEYMNQLWRVLWRSYYRWERESAEWIDLGGSD